MTRISLSWRRLAQSRWWDLAAAMLGIVSVAHLFLGWPQPGANVDFAHYYVGGRLLLEGHNPYTVSLPPFYSAFGFSFHPYESALTATPLFIRSFTLLGRLTPAGAFAALAVVQAACLCAVLLLTQRLLDGRLSARAMRFVWVGALASAPFYWAFCTGHPELFLAALVLLGYHWHRSGRPTAACVAVAAAALLKLFPLVLLPWFVWRGSNGPRDMARRLAGTAGFVVLMVWLTGPGLWRDYFARATPVLVQHSVAPGAISYCVPSFVAMLNYAAHGGAVGDHLLTGWHLGTGLGAALLGLAYWICLRSRRDTEVEFCLLCVAMLAGSALTWRYYFVFLIFPMAAAAARMTACRSGSGVAALVVIYGLLNVMGKPLVLDEYGCWRVVVHFAPVYGLLGLGALFARELRAGCRPA